ncbi:hypothetical protein [Blastochloris viridis]|uniref:Uncharacterized protein n=1 Tax=Blastochloris viridis TaxID=1079 RepID=A0A0H5BJT8_BLAVI|nr:hypothetical protein [Blastochloris viridis]ALK09340.1 hypothetical protein BVIR_1559 [Blastochloris viridis]BAS00782.1 hypothetical protein BV133_3188 [Blastochloris viridis]CUU42003.1 hypothetical protein BVIRIDIS_10040 [Blastochloris viridis]
MPSSLSRRQALLLAAAVVAVPTEGRAGQQDFVDAIIRRIAGTLDASRDNSDWRNKYQLALRNIEDLKKTLQYGGTITSNPVAALRGELGERLKELRTEWEAYNNAEQKIEALRKQEAQGAIADIAGEMISRIVPKPGVLTPLAQARTKNAEIIRQDFARLKTFDEALEKIRDYKKNLLPAIHDTRDRYHGLVPLVEAYAALAPASFDGTYAGSFDGDARGSLTFTISGRQVSGSIQGRVEGDPIEGKFSGSVAEDGTLNTALTGSLRDASKFNLGTFPFRGNLNGRVNGAIGSGNWAGANKHGRHSGNWSASRR